MINRRIQVNRKIFFNSRPKLKFTALKTRKKKIASLIKQLCNYVHVYNIIINIGYNVIPNDINNKYFVTEFNY